MDPRGSVLIAFCTVVRMHGVLLFNFSLYQMRVDRKNVYSAKFSSDLPNGVDLHSTYPNILPHSALFSRFIEV